MKNQIVRGEVECGMNGGVDFHTFNWLHRTNDEIRNNGQVFDVEENYRPYLIGHAIRNHINDYDTKRRFYAYFIIYCK